MFRGALTLPGEAFERVRRAMELPEPRVVLGVALSSIASSAIDVSDGFAGDLGHILAASQVGATIDVDALPRSDDLASLPQLLQRAYTLAGGDDYELVFTAAAPRRAEVEAAGARSGLAVTRVGSIETERGLRLRDAAGWVVVAEASGFDHFAA